MPSSFEISASGLTAERLRMDVISNNIANVDSTRTPEGGPYRRKIVVFEPRTESFFDVLSALTGGNPPVHGVRAVAVVDDPSPPRVVYDPTHPDADKRGYVAYPDINVVKEMVDLITASRAYQANVTAMNETKTMIQAAASIGR